MHFNSIANYERGREPTMEILRRIAEQTGCNLAWLMSGAPLRWSAKRPNEAQDPAALEVLQSDVRLILDVASSIRHVYASEVRRMGPVEFAALVAKHVAAVMDLTRMASTNVPLDAITSFVAASRGIASCDDVDMPSSRKERTRTNKVPVGVR